MLMINFPFQPGHGPGREQGRSSDERRNRQTQNDWYIAASHDAPFDCLRVYGDGLKHMTEVASLDSVTEQFIAGGGAIVRPRMDIPGVGSMISCRDSIGQTFSFFEYEQPVRPEKYRLPTDNIND